ncbi:MAG: adenosylcobinamide-GDP ribazoletransferase [Candidatus Binataceae bacterium]
MSAPPPAAYGADERPRAGFVAEARLAIGFLTILPLMPAGRATDDSVARSFAWFPLVGFAIGALLCVEDLAVRPLLGDTLGALFVILSLSVITGAVHLDALADTADALGAGRDRTRALEIMRDSRIGSYGAIALIFDLAFKVVAVASLSGPPRYVALFLAPGIGRWAMVAVAHRLDYLRNDGAGAKLLLSDASHGLTVATLVTVVALLPFLAARTFCAAAFAGVLVITLRWFYRRWLGGVTGDLIGACGELVEVAVLVAFAA